MEKFKWMYLLVLVSGLILGGCSSENDIIDNIDKEPDIDNTDKKPDIDFSKLTWTKRTISSQIEAGSNTDINTRGASEIGWDGNPSGVLPTNNINYYINVYDGNDNKVEDTVLELTHENNNIIYYTSFGEDSSGNPLAFIKNDYGDMLWFEVGEKQDEVPNGELFFVTTVNMASTDINNSIIPLKTTGEVGENDIYYGGRGYREYGDKLFTTEGLYFVKNSEYSEDNKKIDLYYKDSRTGYSTLADENKIKMKRLTGVITIYTIVIDHYEGQVPINIEGIDGTSTVDAINKTNTALQEAFTKLTQKPGDFFSSEELAANDNALSNFIANQFDTEYRINDYFIRKKVLENYPVEYNFLKGEVNYQGTKGHLYLCNLDFPAWMDEVSSFHWGSTSENQIIHGISSSCDNYPFLPVGNGLILDQNTPLIIFMGMSKPNTEGGVTYNPPSHLLQVKIMPKERMEIKSNISHNMYVVFTIKDMVQMLVKAQMHDAVGTPRTRSALEEPVLELPSNRLIFK